MTAASLLYIRSIYNAQPPALQTAKDDHATLLVSWWCTGFALAAILIRVSGRYIRTEMLFREDKIMFFSIVPLLIRMAFVHVILIWGTNNTATDGLTQTDIYHREVGSKLVLAARIFYALFIWIAKWTILEFLKRLIGPMAWQKSYEIGMRIIEAFLVVTFAAVVVATLAECQPFPHYWQVVPDPGPRCRQGYAQLITMGAADIITDLVLIIFPIPLVLRSTMQTTRKISLILLFLLSLGLVGITAFRVPSTISRRSSQQYRSLLASVEILAASAVANAIVIGSFIRDRGVKKAKFRAQSVSANNLERTPTRSKSIAVAHWGSDEDLVRELGLSLHPTLQHRATSEQIPRPAPVAIPNHNAPTPPTLLAEESVGGTAVNPSWNFANGSRKRRTSVDDSISTLSDELKLRDLESHGNVDAISPAEAPSPNKLSFFDVGGLIENEPRNASTSTDDTAPISAPGNPPLLQTSRHGSRSFRLDLGGVLSSPREDEEEDDVSSHAEHSPPTTSTRNARLGMAPSAARQSSASNGIRRLGGRPPLSTAETDATFRTVPETQTETPAQPTGPDDLSFSDAGGLLR